jgi:hypothetical protein
VRTADELRAEGREADRWNDIPEGQLAPIQLPDLRDPDFREPEPAKLFLRVLWCLEVGFAALPWPVFPTMVLQQPSTLMVFATSAQLWCSCPSDPAAQPKPRHGPRLGQVEEVVFSPTRPSVLIGIDSLPGNVVILARDP